MNINLQKRNKIIFNLFVNNQMDIEEIAKNYKLIPATIKLIIRQYVLTTPLEEDIIKYNQRLVLQQTNMSEMDIKKIYNLFVKYNWQLPINNKDIKDYNISILQLHIIAKLYKTFFIDKNSSIIYDKKNINLSELEELHCSNNLIKLYIHEKKNNYDLSIKTFCSDHNISVNTFNMCINIIQKKNPCLFEQYKQVRIKNEENRSLNKSKDINYLIDCLIYGIEDQSITRKYDSIDFELDFHNEAHNISKIVQELYKQQQITHKELSLVKQFIKKIGFNPYGYTSNENIYPIFNNQDLQDALNSYKEINCQRDKKGYPIKGTGTIIAYEQNKNVIDFINNNNLTLNFVNFQSGISRISLGIKLSKEKKLTK